MLGLIRYVAGGIQGVLTHWGRVTHICVSKLTIIGSDNGLSPGRRQAIIWTNAGILLIGSLGTNFSEILIGIQTFSFKKIQFKMSSAKWHPICLGLNVLKRINEWRNYTLISILFIHFHLELSSWWVWSKTRINIYLITRFVKFKFFAQKFFLIS